MEREAAEGSEATELASNRPTSVTPNLDPRFSRSISMARSEDSSFTMMGTKLMTPTSPLVPLEQLLQQDDMSGKFQYLILNLLEFWNQNLKFDYTELL